MARKKQRVAEAPPPPTGRDEWLEECDRECTFGQDVRYDKTLEQNGLDSLDAVELCLWLEDKYNIEYRGEETAGFMDKTLWAIRCEAEELARRKKTE